MTVKELSQLFYLSKEIELLQTEIARFEMLLTKTNAAMCDMPKGSGGQDKLAKYISEIVYCKELLVIKLNEYIAEEKRLISYINKIDDSFIRTIFRLRFVQLKTWNQVADIIGGGNTEDSCRMAVKRYLK